MYVMEKIANIRLLTVREACDLLNVSRQAIYNWIRDGRIIPVKTPGGRIRIPENQLIVGDAIYREQAMNDMYPIVDISNEQRDRIEQLGSKEKWWFRRDGHNMYLFKAGRENTGDNWAEKVTSELCEIIGLPHAEYDLAIYNGIKGVITPSFLPKGGGLVHGNELLAKFIDEYDKQRFYGQTAHTIEVVLPIIESTKIGLPIGWRGFTKVKEAVDVFVGYLMFDAWVANQDRHHENWALVLDFENQEIHLAPTYDHASSLGRNLTDDNRRSRLYTRDNGRSIERFVERAASAFYKTPESKKPMTTLDAFKEAAIMKPEAARSWINRIAEISKREIRTILNRIPRSEITETSADFAEKILELNRERILHSGF